MRGLTLIGTMIFFGIMTIIGYLFSLISELFKKDTNNRLLSEDIKRQKIMKEFESSSFYKNNLKSDKNIIKINKLKVFRSSSFSHGLPNNFYKNKTLNISKTKLFKKREFRLRSFSLTKSFY